MAIPLTFKKPAKPAASAPVAEPLAKPDHHAALARMNDAVQAFNAETFPALQSLAETIRRSNAQARALDRTMHEQDLALAAEHGLSLSRYIAASDQGAARTKALEEARVRDLGLEGEAMRRGQPDRPDVARLASSLDQHLQAAVLAGDETLTGP